MDNIIKDSFFPYG